MLTITLGSLVTTYLFATLLAFLAGILVRSCFKGADHQRALRDRDYEKGYKDSAVADKERAWKSYHDECDNHTKTKKELKEAKTTITGLIRKSDDTKESCVVLRDQLIQVVKDLDTLANT